MQTIKIQLPRLHQAQLQIKQERRRFNVIDCGRRFGKNILLQDGAVTTALNESLPVGWGAPTYKMLLDDWKALTNTLAPVTQRRNEQEKSLQLVNGGTIEFFSLDNPDAIRGKKFKQFIVNEAAFVANLMDIFNLVIRSTLIDYRGEADFAGTPKGMNGFWQLYQQTGEDWAKWQMSSYANPHIPAEELDALKDTMLERAFQQEIMAQFLEDGGGVFRNVMKAATAELLEKGLDGHTYIGGGDWGRTNDATWLFVMDADSGEVVASDRMTQTDFHLQRTRIKALHERFKVRSWLLESNSIGQPNLEELQRDNIPAYGFVTTNATKMAVIDGLALAFEQGAVKIPKDEILINELMAFESNKTKTGLITYSAPDGLHDDGVIALALAWEAMGRKVESIDVSEMDW